MIYKIHQNRLTIVDIQTLRISSGLEPLNSVMLKRSLSGSLFTLGAYGGDGKVLGMLRIVGDGAYVFVISDLLVDPVYRGQGIGKELVITAVDTVSKLIPSGRWSTVTLVSAVGRESFYEELGFHKLPYGAAGSAMQTYIHGSANEA